MKSKAVKQGKPAERQRHSEEFKKQALERADKDGVSVVTKDLGLHASQLYGWRQKRQQEGQTSDEQRLMLAENARIKRELARLEEENTFLKKAAAYFAKVSK